jgi:S-adenosylmethionine:tRNA ribosyltransferase-isomerase
MTKDASADFSDRIADYDFALPETQIAQSPSPRREDARLLVVRRSPAGGLPRFEDLRVSELPALAAQEPSLKDALWVRNVSKVIPARFYARRASGGVHEIVLTEERGADVGLQNSSSRWDALIRRSARFSYPQELFVDTPMGERRIVSPEVGVVDIGGLGADPLAVLQQIGEMPLPPYIRERIPERDRERYQTIWARDEHAKSVAAPTASLHFTPTLVDALRAQGAEFCDLVLHVGLGTFEPVRGESLAGHELHSERVEAPAPTLHALEKAIAQKRPCVALGTTALRSLESLPLAGHSQAAGADLVATADGGLRGRTRLFVRPGFEFRHTTALMTNFHLPQSTLLVLVSCFAGSRTLALEAYRHAVAKGYRFFSFGDASIWL